MGVNVICCCHTCKKFVDIDKEDTCFWLISDTVDLEGIPESIYEYELHHMYRLSRFIFQHQYRGCNIDMIHDEFPGEENHYSFIRKNYEEIDFKERQPEWERSQQNISYCNVRILADEYERSKKGKGQ